MTSQTRGVFDTANPAGVQHRLFLRALGLLGLAAVCAIFPSVGPNRFLLAGCLTLLTPVPLLLPRLVPPERWMALQSIFDVSATVLLIAFVPNVWAAGLVIVASSPAASAPLLGRRLYLGIELFGLGGLGIVALLTDAEDWVVPLTVAALMVPLVASYISVFLSKELTAVAHLDEVAQSSSATFWEIDPRSGEFLSISGQVKEVFGYEPEDLPLHLPKLFIGDERRELWHEMRDNPAGVFVQECRMRRSDGEEFWARVHVRRMVVRDQQVLRGTAYDITELVEAHEAVRKRAEVDHLTGLANRYILVQNLEGFLESGRSVALYVLDLDRFKDVNDTLGHQAGDEFLTEMARRLAEAAPDGSVVARMGGDEFAIVDASPAGLDSVMAMAQDLVAACQGVVAVGGLEFSGSASCGVSVSPMHGVNAEALLRRADLAMYAAKRTGLGLHLFEFEADEAKVSKLRLSSEAESALSNGELCLWFQPKIDFTTGQVMGAEALLRWAHPSRGILLPAEFLDVIELSRHRRALCREVVHQGAAFIVDARARGRDLQVAVNVSIRDLMDPDITEVVRTELDLFGVDPSQFVLEITERDLMDDRAGFARVAEAVRDSGVGLAIDDFGTGHSSLLRLHQLPVTELKIDRSFISGIGIDDQAGIIVRSIIELGRSLGHRVVAEGIERVAEVDVLRSLGCDLGQGYLFSPAVPVSDFLAMIDRYGWDGSTPEAHKSLRTSTFGR